MGEPCLLESPWKIVEATDIPLVPAPEMGQGGQTVPLAAVTGAVGQDEVMPQAQGIAAPGNEVVHRPRGLQAPVTVEAPPLLDILENLPVPEEVAPGGAEQEMAELGRSPPFSTFPRWSSYSARASCTAFTTAA